MTLQLQLLAEMILAMVLGGLIGFEREKANKPAGLRTHMLVAGSAAFLTGLGSVIVPEMGIDQTILRADPIRIIEAVVTGVSFLGAGTIIRNRQSEDQVEGLTTAASLLLTSALGIGIAVGQFFLSIGAAIIVLLILRGVKFLEPDDDKDD